MFQKNTIMLFLVVPSGTWMFHKVHRWFISVVYGSTPLGWIILQLYIYVTLIPLATDHLCCYKKNINQHLISSIKHPPELRYISWSDVAVVAPGQIQRSGHPPTMAISPKKPRRITTQSIGGMGRSLIQGPGLILKQNRCCNKRTDLPTMMNNNHTSIPTAR